MYMPWAFAPTQKVPDMARVYRPLTAEEKEMRSAGMRRYHRRVREALRAMNSAGGQA
jgi:hypothetical protein